MWTGCCQCSTCRSTAEFATPEIKRVNSPATRLKRLNTLIAEIWDHNSFYAGKWARAGVQRGPLASLSELAAFPVTRRHELVADQLATPPLGRNIMLPLDGFKRFHRSSGTTCAPLVWA